MEDISLEEIRKLGDAGAPDEWLACKTGQGIPGLNQEGLSDRLIEQMLKGVDISDFEDSTIQADYAIQYHQCNSQNYTKGRSGYGVSYITVHYTSGSRTSEGAALANCIYFSNGSRGASAHYFVDDGATVWQSVDDSDTAWHAGNWNMNVRAIGIEVCSDGVFTGKEIDRLHWLVWTKMKQYDIPPSRVIRHYDVTGKQCPAWYVDDVKWKALHKVITSEYASEEEPEVVTNEDIQKIAEAVWNFQQNGTKMRDRVQGTDAAANATLKAVKTEDTSGRTKGGTGLNSRFSYYMDDWDKFTSDISKRLEKIEKELGIQ